MPRVKANPNRCVQALCHGYECGGPDRNTYISNPVSWEGCICKTCKENAGDKCVICDGIVDLSGVGCQVTMTNMCTHCVIFHQEICDVCVNLLVPTIC